MFNKPEADPTRFRVSVIIPVLNDETRVIGCLECLKRQTWPQAQFEVLVVDNGSETDLASVVARYPFAKLLHEASPGSYAARNKGLEHVTGNIIAFTDSDCLPDEAWIENGVRAVQEAGPKVLVGGRVALFAQDPQSPTIAEDFELVLGFSQATYLEQKHYGVTANLFTTPHVFATVGPFNSELKSGGDKEFGQRVHSAGFPLVYCETALVRHPARRTMQELFKKRKRLVGGHLGIARSRYPEWLAVSIVFGKACLPPVERLLKVRKKGAGKADQARPKPRTPLSKYVRVFAVGVSLQAYSALEVVRLKLGKSAER